MKFIEICGLCQTEEWDNYTVGIHKHSVYSNSLEPFSVAIFIIMHIWIVWLIIHLIHMYIWGLCCWNFFFTKMNSFVQVQMAVMTVTSLSQHWFRCCLGAEQMANCHLNWWWYSSQHSMLPDGTQPLPEPVLTYHQGLSLTFNFMRIPHERILSLIHNICLVITVLKLEPHLSGPMS